MSVVTEKATSPNLIRVALAAIMLLFVVLALAYNFVTPAATGDQHNPDENAHLLYVQSLASGHLPVFHAGENSYESHQPPLYYVLCTPVYFATHGAGDAAAIHAIRIVSTVLGMFLILVTYLCVATLLPKEPWVALGTAAFVAFLPMNVAQNASVTNDTLTNFVIGVALWWLAKMVMQANSATVPRLWLRQSIWLGVILGLGILTKSSTLLLFPTVALAFVLLVRQRVIDGPLALRAGMISLGLGLAIGAPWFLRNTMLYGDPLAQHIFETAFVNTAKTEDVARALGGLDPYFAGVAKWTFASYWGVFDSMTLFWGRNPLNLHAPSVLRPLTLPYNLVAALSSMSLVGVISYVRRRPSRLDVNQGILLAAFLVLIALTGLAFFRFILVFFQAQGRYWYPALIPFSFLFMLGWRGLFPQPSQQKIVTLLITLGLLGLNAYTIFGLLIPRFRVQ